MTPEAIRERVRGRLAEQRVLVRELLKRRELLAGSLFERWAVCGKEGCSCRTGQKHGPYYVLSTRSGGQGGFSYLGSDQMGEARVLVKAYREYRAGLRRLRRVNDQVLELLRRYQEETARRGGRRVGVAHRPTA